MLAEFVQKIADMTAPTVKEINGRYYTSKQMVRIERVVDKPEGLELYSLDSTVKLIQRDCVALPAPLFVHITRHDQMDVFSDYADEQYSSVRYKRFPLCSARCVDVKPLEAVTWEYETALIALRSIFEPNEGTEYLLNLLSTVTEEDSAKSEDNGMSQTVTVKRGIALKERVEVKPRVKLKPFRTFLEVEQPESEFLVRMLPEKKIHVREADGGIWKLEAKRRIAAYMTEHLGELVTSGEVVVMM